MNPAPPSKYDMPEDNYQQYPIDFLDRDNPRSLVNLAPDSLSNAIVDLFNQYPELTVQDERTLWKELAKRKATPSPTLSRLRVQFWNAYDICQSHMASHLKLSSVYSGVCSREFLYKKVFTRPEFLAWILCPPTRYTVAMEEALTFGIEQLREILEMPMKDEKGKINTSLGNLKAKIVLALDQRVKGAIPQEIRQLNLNYNTPADGGHLQSKTAEEEMKAIQAKIKKLEARSVKSFKKNPVKDPKNDPLNSPIEDVEYEDIPKNGDSGKGDEPS